MKQLIRRILCALLGLVLAAGVFSCAAAEGELRGYSEESGYVYVFFGRYPQTIDGGIPNDGKQAQQWRKSYQKNKVKGEMREQGIDPAAVEPTPILWRVLAADEEKIFLCSEYILFPAPMHSDRKEYKVIGSDFGQTELCARLNGEFMETAFSPEETDMLILRETFGKVFILSAEEMDDKSLGFGTKQSRKTWATEYAVRACGAFVYQASMGCHSPCWTRSQSKTKTNAARCTKQEGTIGYYDCTNPEEGARPAVWMKPDGFRIVSGSGTREDPYVLAAEGGAETGDTETEDAEMGVTDTGDEE